MKHERLAVAADLNVAFDGAAGRDRRFGRAKRVFDHALLRVVQTAMGDRTLRQPGGSDQGSQGAISNSASTSTSAFSGRCETPTVARA